MLVLGHGKNLADYIRTGKVLSSPKVEIMREKNLNIRGFHLWCEAPMRP